MSSSLKAKCLKFLNKAAKFLISNKLLKDEINLWWVQFYNGYSHEKGWLKNKIDLKKALKCYEERIKSHEEGLFPPLRKAFVLKKLGMYKEAQDAYNYFIENFYKRDKEDHPCFFYFIMGKSIEKYENDPKRALEFYEDGI